ncbi:MAG TPA: ATP-binding protein [Candidatus Dormibacteraeota bacterium]|nr:ATP-binding protein [Candidatus Dormibacteraeota bacterium]
MNTATPFPWPVSSEESTRTTFRAIFEHAPVAVARCNPQGMIVEMNPAFERTLDRGVASRRSLRLCELVRPQDREKTELLLSDLLASRRDRIRIEASGAGPGQSSALWTAWRQPSGAGEPDHALLIAEPSPAVPAEEGLLQTQRWEAVGRLAGGVVHDFNNLLTGVMLYCDLLLTSLDARDRRRRYADEIRSAIVQATGLVRQLLIFARPQAAPARLLCLNEVAKAMRDLLSRLIGENTVLDLHLDPELGAVNIDQAQAQQILLNLVLNARDALPNGGRITVETSNCKFQPVAGTMPAGGGVPAFPCILLVVGDNGRGMDAETRQHLFEPFFTTKNAGQGTGLGLTTVRTIVTTNRGLIHFESEPGRGTRVLILLPRAFPSGDPNSLDPSTPDSATPPPTPFQELKKESPL